VPTEPYTPRDNSNSAPGDDGGNASRVLDRSLDLVRFLRVRCEWDAAQTPRTLVPYLLEEAHETAEAINREHDEELRGELGDLLLNVAFQIVLAEEREAFSAEDVVGTLEAKMRRRHPHIYGEGERVPWETLKAQERAGAETPRSLLHGIASGLEPLSKAQRIQDRVATVGFDWSDWRGAFEKVAEELEEVRELLHAPARQEKELEEELGDLLFAVVNLTRLSGAHAMRALQRANGKFAGRFEALEMLARDRDVVLGEATLEELDELWDEVKARERSK
jgi:MazG family protein